MNERQHEGAPSENIHCIWMDAGVVGYKLCDSGLDCDRCAFHHVMLQHTQAANRSIGKGSDQSEHSSQDFRELPPQDSFDAVIDRLLSPIRHTEFPEDRSYSLHHLWVAENDSGEFTIGVDHVIPQLVSSIHGIVLPRRLTRLHRDMPFAWLLTSAGVLPLPAPVGGVVVNSNQELADHPEWLTGSPYDDAWIVRGTRESTENLERLLFPAEHVRQSNQLQLEAMQLWIRAHASGGQAHPQTLCDGGSFVQSLHELIGQEHYPLFLREFLSTHPR